MWENNILTMFALGTLLKDTKRVKTSYNNDGIIKNLTHIRAVKTYHVIAPSVLFNADIALRTLRIIRTARRLGWVSSLLCTSLSKEQHQATFTPQENVAHIGVLNSTSDTQLTFPRLLLSEIVTSL